MPLPDAAGLFIAPSGVEVDREAVDCGGLYIYLFAGGFVLVFGGETVLCRALGLAEIELAVNVGVNGGKRTRRAVSVDPFGFDFRSRNACPVLKEHAALDDHKRASIDMKDQSFAKIGSFIATNFDIVSNRRRIALRVKNEVVNAGLEAVYFEFTLFVGSDGANIL